MSTYTRRIGYQYTSATAEQSAETGLLFTLTSTLRGHVWRVDVNQWAKHAYYRDGQPAPLPTYAMGLFEAAERLFHSARKPG